MNSQRGSIDQAQNLRILPLLHSPAWHYISPPLKKKKPLALNETIYSIQARLCSVLLSASTQPTSRPFGLFFGLVDLTPDLAIHLFWLNPK